MFQLQLSIHFSILILIENTTYTNVGDKTREETDFINLNRKSFTYLLFLTFKRFQDSRFSDFKTVWPYYLYLSIRQVRGTSLVVQWLRLCTPAERSRSSIPGQGTRIPQAPSPAKRGLRDIVGLLHCVKTQ